MRPMSRGAADLKGPASSNGSTPSKKWRRRQCIEDLLASCSVEVLKLERGAAREVAASEHAVRLISARSLSQSASSAPPLELSSSSSAPAPLPAQRPAQTGHVNGSSRDSTPEGIAIVAPAQQPSMIVEERLAPDGVLDSTAWASRSTATADGKLAQSHCATERTSQGPRGSASAVGTELLRVLARENTVLECNIRDYDTALNGTIEEAVRLKSEVRQLESVCGQVGQLRELLQREKMACSELRDHNAFLAARRVDLMTAVRQAAEVSDSESSFLIDGLISQNTALRRLLSAVETGSSKTSLAANQVALRWSRGNAFNGSPDECDVLVGSSQQAGGIEPNDLLRVFKPAEDDCAGTVASSALADRSADVLAEEIHAGL